MKQISLDTAQALPELDQLKILKALVSLLSEYKEGIRFFSYYDQGIVIEEITSGEYTVSLGGPIPVCNQDDLKNIFPYLFKQIAALWPALNCAPLKNIGDNTATAVIENCDYLIKTLNAESREKSKENKKNHETALGLAFKRLKKEFDSIENITVEIPSIHNHEKPREKHRTNTYIFNPKHLTQKGGFSKFIPGKEAIKINKKNGRITAITHQNVNTKYYKEGEIKSITTDGVKISYYKTGEEKSIKSNGIKTNLDQNGIAISQKKLDEEAQTKLLQASIIEQAFKLYRNKHHPSKTPITPNHRANYKETEIFKGADNNSKGGYSPIDHSNYHGVSVIREIEGDNLFDYLEKNLNTMDETELCKLFLAAIEGLENFHNATIKIDGIEKNHTHCDVKPENMIVSKNNKGIFKVTFVDVGMAGQQDSIRTKACGTPFYTPFEVENLFNKNIKVPQQARKRLKEHDYYSLAASFLLPCLALKIDHSFLGDERELFHHSYAAFNNKKEKFPDNFILNPKRNPSTPISRLFCWNPSSLIDCNIINSVKQQLNDTIEKNNDAKTPYLKYQLDNNCMFFNKRIIKLKEQRVLVNIPYPQIRSS